MKLMNILYNVHILPQLVAIAEQVYQKGIVQKKLSVIAIITEGVSSDYKYGSYAVREAWSDLDDILRPFFDYRKDSALAGDEYVDMLDLLVDDLKKHKLIYLEW